MAEAGPRRYAISILIEPAFRGWLDRAALRRLAVRVLKAEGVAPPAEVGLVVTDDETVRDLNRRYLDLDEPTDVLSFGHEPFDRLRRKPFGGLRTKPLGGLRTKPLGGLRTKPLGGLRTKPLGGLRTKPLGGLTTEPFVTPPDGVRRLGEVILSYPTAERQAEEAGRSVQEEAAHLVVHGLLHLLGYDHEDPKDRRRMRAREKSLLGG